MSVQVTIVAKILLLMPLSIVSTFEILFRDTSVEKQWTGRAEGRGRGRSTLAFWFGLVGWLVGWCARNYTASLKLRLGLA